MLLFDGCSFWLKAKELFDDGCVPKKSVKQTNWCGEKEKQFVIMPDPFSEEFIGKFLLKQLFGNGLSKPEREEAITT